MDTNARHLVDPILKHKTLSHADFRRLDELGDDGFDYIKELLPRAQTARHKINGLSLLVRLGGQISERHGDVRLPEVFDVASDLLGDPDAGVRTSAARMIVGVLGLLKTLEKPLETLGGTKRVWETLQRALKAKPKPAERMLVEKALMTIEPMLTA
jgi:hypothetical protein